jgi:hypothetical protein
MNPFDTDQALPDDDEFDTKRVDDGPDGQWRQRDGTCIPICKMSDGHLTNTIKMLMRGAQMRCSSETVQLLSMPAPNGDMAYDAYSSECAARSDMNWEDYTGDKYDELMDEYEDRGLDLKVINEYGTTLAKKGAMLELASIIKIKL